MKTSLIISILLLAVQLSKTPQPAYSSKIYGNVANFFEDAGDIAAFFEFKHGEVVAEIGAFDGQNIGGFALLTDSITFYVQDISREYLNDKTFGKVLDRCSKFKDPLTCEFHLKIGTVKSTELPEGIFDKIIIISAFHEFTYMDEMITDISAKLKPEGQLIILETNCLTPGHNNYTLEETNAILDKYHYSLQKVDTTNRNGSSGMYKAIYSMNGKPGK